jgi:hypothetical protein
MSDVYIKELKAFLEVERLATSGGDFDKLEGIAATKVTYFAKIPSLKLSRAELYDLNELVSRNQTILNAAISGIKSARAHILATKKSAKKMNVYNETGVIETFDSSPAKNYKKF